MTNEDIIRMAREAGWPIEAGEELPNTGSMSLERFHTLTRNATLDEIANKIEAMPFGDTAASFAVLIREQKT